MINNSNITPEQRMFIAVVQAFPINSLVNYKVGDEEHFGLVKDYLFTNRTTGVEGIEILISNCGCGKPWAIEQETWLTPKDLNNQSFLNTLIWTWVHLNMRKPSKKSLNAAFELAIQRMTNDKTARWICFEVPKGEAGDYIRAQIKERLNGADSYEAWVCQHHYDQFDVPSKQKRIASRNGRIAWLRSMQAEMCGCK